MKPRFLLLAFIFSFITLRYVQGNELPHGIALCDEIYDLCASCGITPEIQNLVSNGKNAFPYNISVSFPKQTDSEKNNENLRNTLLVIIKQDDAFTHPEILKNLLIGLSAEKRDFNIKIIMAFGDSQTISKKNAIKGTLSFLTSIDNPAAYSCILLSLDGEKAKIVPGSGGAMSPTWFVQDIYRAYQKSGLLHGYDNNYISYIHTLNLTTEPLQEAFLKAGIPCIKTCFGEKTPDKAVSETILNIIDNYDCEKTGRADYHSIMYTLFSKQIWLTEETIIKAILFSVFAALFILFSYAFINKRFKFVNWKQARKIWHYPFTIYFLSIFVFLLSQRFISHLKNKFFLPISLYTSISFTLAITFVIVSLAFFVVLRYSPNFTGKTIDHLFFISSTVNLWIFCLIDISLFPIFAFGFLLAMFSTFFTKNYFHAFVLPLSILPFLPFILQVFNNADIFSFNLFFASNKLFLLLFMLVVLPEQLLFFRLFTNISIYWITNRKITATKQDSYNIICLTMLSAVIVLSIFCATPPSFRREGQTNIEKKIVLHENTEKLAAITVSKRRVFGDVIRTVQIDCQKPIKQCDLRIRGKNNSPVLFSDNDCIAEFIAENSTDAVFLIPYEPPSKMEFSYGEIGIKNKIILTVVYEDLSMERIEKTILD